MFGYVFFSHLGIEANDLNSLLEQFEETEATLKIAETSRSSTPLPVPPPEVNPSLDSM